MRFFSSIVYMALVASTFNMAATTAFTSSDVEPLRAREVDVPFHARQSSLIDGSHRRMHRRAVGCRAKSTAQQKISASKKHSSKDDDEKKKSSKKHSDNDDKKKKQKSSKMESSKKTSSSKNKKESHKKSSNNDSNSDGNDVISKAKGLIGMTFGGQCRNPHASAKYPNGDISFLNCGISKSNKQSKWSPPDVKMGQLRVISSAQAAKSNVYKPCAQHKYAFDNAAKKTGVPAVLLMAIAMQESTCNAKERGGNGEIGLMQLTPDKCDGKNCWDASTNVLLGAKYFQSQLDTYNGNVLLALGAYNGWHDGLTYSHATDLQYGCHAQNNLDYLNQMLNGWLQGKYGYELLTYNNLAKCSN